MKKVKKEEEICVDCKQHPNKHATQYVMLDNRYYEDRDLEVEDRPRRTRPTDERLISSTAYERFVKYDDGYRCEACSDQHKCRVHLLKNPQPIVVNPDGSFKRSPISQALRHEVFKRDEYKCIECGSTDKDSILHVDHMLPVSQGGTDEMSNLQTLCSKCNLAKSNRCW